MSDDVINLESSQALTFEYAAMRAGKPADGVFVGELAHGYMQRRDSAAEGEVGVKEFSESEFQNFKHACPRCGFEFDKPADAPAT